MKLYKNRQEQNWFFRKLKWITNSISLIFIIAIIVILVTSAVFVLNKLIPQVSSIMPNGQGSGSATLEEFKNSFKILDLVLGTIYPKSMHFSNLFIYTVIFFFVFRVLANLLYMSRSVYDKRTIIKSNSILVVRLLRHFFSIIFYFLIIVGIAKLNGFLITITSNVDFKNIFTQFNGLSNLVQTGGGINNITEEWVNQNQNQINQYLDAMNQSIESINNLFNIDMLQNDAPLIQGLLFLIIGFAGIDLNTLILGLTSLIQVRKYQSHS